MKWLVEHEVMGNVVNKKWASKWIWTRETVSAGHDRCVRVSLSAARRVKVVKRVSGASIISRWTDAAQTLLHVIEDFHHCHSPGWKAAAVYQTLDVQGLRWIRWDVAASTLPVWSFIRPLMSCYSFLIEKFLRQTWNFHFKILSAKFEQFQLKPLSDALSFICILRRIPSERGDSLPF